MAHFAMCARDWQQRNNTVPAPAAPSQPAQQSTPTDQTNTEQKSRKQRKKRNTKWKPLDLSESTAESTWGKDEFEVVAEALATSKRITNKQLPKSAVNELEEALLRPIKPQETHSLTRSKRCRKTRRKTKMAAQAEGKTNGSKTDVKEPNGTFIPPHLRVRAKEQVNGDGPKPVSVPPHLRNKDGTVKTNPAPNHTPPPHRNGNSHANGNLSSHAVIPPHLRKFHKTNGIQVGKPQSPPQHQLAPEPNVANISAEAPAGPTTTPIVPAPTETKGFGDWHNAWHTMGPQPPSVKAEVHTEGVDVPVDDNWKKSFVYKPDPAVDIWDTTVEEDNMTDWDNQKTKRGAKPKQWRGNGPNPAPRGKTRWPKAKDMKPRPESEESDGGIECASKSNGDPEYDIRKLVDWKGDWMPAPVEWDSRKAYHDRHFYDHIMSWMNRCIDTENWMTAVRLIPTNMDAAAREDALKHTFETSAYHAKVNGDLVPQSWVPTKIEAMAPQHFWAAFPSRAPPPLSDIDLAEARPWWDTHNPSTCLNVPIDMPETRLDMEDHENNLPQVSRGSAMLAMANKQKGRQRAIQKARAVPERPVSRVEVPDRSIKLKTDVYLRPVIVADIPQIMELYNHYVANTISAHEFLPRTVPQMSLRVQNVMNAGLPWIVAIHRAGTRNNQDYFTEQVVGFANIDDFVEPGSMYRYSFDLEIFVHVDYCKMGIGSCLLDRMLEMCDTSHFLNGGYDWINRDDYLKNGPSRVVKTINFTFPHDANDQGQPKQVDNIKKWLKSFGFRASGHLHQVGFKLGKTVDTSIFQRSTTEEIAADQRPDHPL